MFKIGDFSRIGQVSVRMLRHYDKLGLLKPSHTDRFTGYRYYTIDQLATLHRIVALNDLGLTLQQIAPLIQAGDELPIDQLRGMLTLRQHELARELQEKQAQLAGVSTRLALIDQAGKPLPYEVLIKPLPTVAVASVRSIVPHIHQMDHYCLNLYKHLYDALDRHGVTPRDAELTLYHADQYIETDLEVEVATEIDRDLLAEHPVEPELHFRELSAADQAATLIYEGPYQAITPAVMMLLNWIGHQGYLPAGPLRELHHSGRAHIHGVVQAAAVLEFQLPLRTA
ncbi:MAG: MerR family transcriptional regulator [Oscillochloris sp.]|nr:MerR family transcriptional regulator [Oscillochloris sp.]